MTRDDSLQFFLNQNGWGSAERKLLAADASFRHYDRLFMNGKTAVLMNAPKPENPAQFATVDKILAAAGARVPQIFVTDFDNGFLLLEDFGDDTFARLIARGTDEFPLYQNAITELVDLQKNMQSDLSMLPNYDMEKMLFECSLLPDWFIPHAVGKKLSDDARKQFDDIWIPLIERIQKFPKTLVLLDYHVDNLMMTPDNRCGMLDFQDARLGPALYDLISLIEDARRPVSPEIQNTCIKMYLDAFPEYTSDFETGAALIAAQRHTKIIGIFTRLCARDGKDRYLKFIPFVWTLLEKHLDLPIFKPYKDWLDQNVPTQFRTEVPYVAKP